MLAFWNGQRCNAVAAEMQSLQPGEGYRQELRVRPRKPLRIDDDETQEEG